MIDMVALKKEYQKITFLGISEDKSQVFLYLKKEGSYQIRSVNTTSEFSIYRDNWNALTKL